MLHQLLQLSRTAPERNRQTLLVPTTQPSQGSFIIIFEHQQTTYNVLIFKIVVYERAKVGMTHNSAIVVVLTYFLNGEGKALFCTICKYVVVFFETVKI